MMAGKKNYAVVAVVADLTSEQAAQIEKEITKAKRKYAPHGRGTVASGGKSAVAGMLQSGKRRKLERK